VLHWKPCARSTSSRREPRPTLPLPLPLPLPPSPRPQRGVTWPLNLSPALSPPSHTVLRPPHYLPLLVLQLPLLPQTPQPHPVPLLPVLPLQAVLSLPLRLPLRLHAPPAPALCFALPHSRGDTGSNCRPAPGPTSPQAALLPGPAGRQVGAAPAGRCRTRGRG